MDKISTVMYLPSIPKSDELRVENRIHLVDHRQGGSRHLFVSTFPLETVFSDNQACCSVREAAGVLGRGIIKRIEGVVSLEVCRTLAFSFCFFCQNNGKSVVSFPCGRVVQESSHWIVVSRVNS